MTVTLAKTIRIFAALSACVLLVVTGPGRAQYEDPQIQGEWRMELRVRHLPGVVLNQQNITLFVIEQLADGTFRVLTHFTIHAVGEKVDQLSRPECEGRTECTYDGGSEGIGRLVGDKFYIDWLDESWIDDVLTISGNRMVGDDGNGPIDLTKID